MFKNLILTRPLAILDLETTGRDPKVDRIVEISVLKILPDGTREHKTRRVNPGIPIPPDATELHGIADSDVANESTLAFFAESLIEFLDGCDFCGFNIRRFDLPILQAELKRAKLRLPLENRGIVDAQDIFHAYERRDLITAVQFYCDKIHSHSHSAASDVLATVEVLDAMLARYPNLPRSVSGLHEFLHDPNAVDLEGRFVKRDGKICFAFGKHENQPLETVAKESPDYLDWMLSQDFSEEIKNLVRNVLKNTKPSLCELPIGKVSLWDINPFRRFSQ